MSKKLYVGNLPFSATEADVTEAFAVIGNVLSVKLINDRETGRPRGFGFVEMEKDADADAAIAEMNGRDLGGRELVVNEARPQERRESGNRGRDNRGNSRGGDRSNNRR